MNICTVEDVRLVMGLADDSQDELIERLIGAVTRFVERKTRRSLTITASGVRYFDGNDKGYLIVDDFQQLVTVELLNPDNTVWKTFSALELRSEPYNTTPKNKLIIVNYASENPYRIVGRSPFIFPRGYANVRVTANWGSYVVIPDDLVDLGINLVRAKVAKAPMRGIRQASIGGESVTFTDNDLDDSMKDVLNDHTRYYSEVWP